MNTNPLRLDALHRELLGGIYWSDYPMAPLDSTPTERRLALAKLLDAGYIQRAADNHHWLLPAGDQAWRSAGCAAAD